MQRLLITILCSVYFIFPFTANAEGPEDEWTTLDLISNEILTMAQQNRFDDSKQLLHYFSDFFSSVQRYPDVLSMDQLRVITITHQDALVAVSSNELTYEEKVNTVTKFRLVVDAMKSEFQPLWIQLESSIMNSFDQMKQSAVEGNEVQFQENLNIFLSKLNLIKPSLQVDVHPDQVKLLDSHVNYLNLYQEKIVHEARHISQLSTIEKDLEVIFNNMEEDEADPSFVWVLFTTGGFILATLSYVGWKKYKGESTERKNKDKGSEG